jgi:nitrate/TMAO reductase-like tetraheme cytochrome c subunit
MKISQSILTCLALIVFGMALWEHRNPSVAGESVESSCIECHTNLKKLIKLIWKIEEMQPKSQKSEEISGEG